jgi:hypothetical protein
MRAMKLSFKILGSASIMGLGYMNLKYSSLMGPVEGEQKRQPDQKRSIAIVGAGVIGLSTAYYLSMNPSN